MADSTIGRNETSRPRRPSAADSGCGKPDLLLALFTIEGTENRLPVRERGRPRRIHRTARVEAVVQIPQMPQLVHAAARNPLEPFLQIFHPMGGHHGAILSVPGIAMGGDG